MLASEWLPALKLAVFAAIVSRILPHPMACQYWSLMYVYVLSAVQWYTFCLNLNIYCRLILSFKEGSKGLAQKDGNCLSSLHIIWKSIFSHHWDQQQQGESPAANYLVPFGIKLSNINTYTSYIHRSLPLSLLSDQHVSTHVCFGSGSSHTTGIVHRGSLSSVWNKRSRVPRRLVNRVPLLVLLLCYRISYQDC